MIARDAEVAKAIRMLSRASIESPRLEARVLWEHARGNGAAFASYVARRAAREPLAYIVGHKEFWSLDFLVRPGVLIPRPETETIIEQAMKYFPDKEARLRAVDLGSGSGCLIVSFLKEYSNAVGLAIDLSEEACEVTILNARRNMVLNRCEVVRGDWGKEPPPPADVILANPPYIPGEDLRSLADEVALYEPVLAMDGGADGLDAYRRLAPTVAGSLRPGGCAFVEVGAGQAQPVADLMRQSELQVLDVVPDLAGIPRVLVTRTCG